MGLLPRMAGARHNLILVIFLQTVISVSNGQYEEIAELARSKRQQPSNMPSIIDLDVSCEKTGMTVDLTFSAPFDGIVFSKGHYSNPACRYVRRNSKSQQHRITVPLSGCGTSTVEASSDRLMIENTLIIQMDAMVQDIWDSARKITCDWQSKLEKVITFSPFGVADLKQVAEVKFAGSGDNVRTWMEIQFGRGPFAAPLEGLTKIGDELTVVIYADDGGAGYDMMVKNCFAHDDRNFQRANKIRLLNDHGCLFRPHQMEYFSRTFDTRNTGADLIAFARMNAFKFPDKMDVYLSCELELCKGGCDTHCEKADYPIDIIENLSDRPVSRELPAAESIEVTTFRPTKLKKILKGVMKRRKPKDFGPDFVNDDAVDILEPPKELSPELLQLLKEIGAVTEKASFALAQRTESPLTAPVPGFSFEPTAEGEKMSFSTIFGGTHVTSDIIPPQILNNDRKFQPSQLLSASIDEGQSDITSFSRGVSGSNNVFPVRMTIPEQTTNRLPVGANQLLDEVDDGLHGPFFKLESLGESGNINRPVPGHNNNKEIQNISNNIEVLDNTINTLQQQLNKEGNGFKPISNTTPNILSTTLIFTSPRSVEMLKNKLSENPTQPKQVLLKVLDNVPGAPRPPRNLGQRPRYGAKLENIRFKREASGDEAMATQPDNVFAKESVNLVKGFQVVSATDLAFQTSTLEDLVNTRRKTGAELDSEICFAETSFYAGLLVMCSLLLLSSLVSVCSIKQVRKLNKDENGFGKRFFFGSHLRDAFQ